MTQMTTREIEIKRLESFLEMKEDWDSCGAAKIKPDAVEDAIKFAELLPDEFWVAHPYDKAFFPLSGGNVTFETEFGGPHGK